MVYRNMYIAAGIFRGRKLSWIGGKMGFRRVNFRGLLAHSQCTVDRALKQWRRKLSLIGTNLRKFSPSEVSRYTVMGRVLPVETVNIR